MATDDKSVSDAHTGKPLPAPNVGKVQVWRKNPKNDKERQPVDVWPIDAKELMAPSVDADGNEHPSEYTDHPPDQEPRDGMPVGGPSSRRPQGQESKPDPADPQVKESDLGGRAGGPTGATTPPPLGGKSK